MRKGLQAELPRHSYSMPALLIKEDTSVMESGYRSRRSSLCASLVPIGRSADREMVSQGEIAPWLWVAAVQHRMCGDDGTHAAVDDTVYRRLRPRLPQEPHPPRRAHGTLQPQDESVIAGYYTSAEVFPPQPTFSKILIQEVFCLWQEATVLTVPAQETQR